MKSAYFLVLALVLAGCLNPATETEDTTLDAGDAFDAGCNVYCDAICVNRFDFNAVDGETGEPYVGPATVGYESLSSLYSGETFEGQFVFHREGDDETWFEVEAWGAMMCPGPGQSVVVFAEVDGYARFEQVVASPCVCHPYDLIRIELVPEL